MTRWITAAMLFASLGCCSTPSHTGWHFSIIRPPAIDYPLAVQDGGNPLGLGGVATLPGVGMRAPVAFEAPGIVPPPPRSFTPMTSTPAPDCTMDEVCRLLRKIDARLEGERLPMPRAAPNPSPGPCP
jgi:hypothetical protein